jgi:hypothetical protein
MKPLYKSWNYNFTVKSCTMQFDIIEPSNQDRPFICRCTSSETNVLFIFKNISHILSVFIKTFANELCIHAYVNSN